MHLSMIKNILDKIDFKKSYLNSESYDEKQVKINNLINFKIFFSNIKDFSFFNKEVFNIRSSKLIKTETDELITDKEEITNILNSANYLLDASSALYRVLYKLLPSPDDKSIFIKLPETQEFNQIVNTLATINTSLQQVILHEDIKGKINIRNWEANPFIVELFLGKDIAVRLMASIVWSSVVIENRIKEAQSFEQYAKSLKMKIESLNDLKKGQTELINELYESEAKNILDEHFTQRDDNELLKRIKLNIRNFSKLIQNGVEIYSPLNVPEKIQNLFPNFNQLNTVTLKEEKLKDIITVSSKEEKLKDVKIKINKSFVLSKN